MREPRRAALGVLYELLGEELLARPDLPPVAAFPPAERPVLRRMLEQHVNSPPTSSAGRLFDAVASILGLRQRVSFEGQAAMELEFAAEAGIINESYPFEIGGDGGPLVVDWGPMIRAILRDLAGGEKAGVISGRFHNTLVEIILDVARRAGEERVLLTGGCFQNRYLLERALARLRETGLRAFRHRRVPPNDGGVALGQLVWAGLRAGRGDRPTGREGPPGTEKR